MRSILLSTLLLGALAAAVPEAAGSLEEAARPHHDYSGKFAELKDKIHQVKEELQCVSAAGARRRGGEGR